MTSEERRESRYWRRKRKREVDKMLRSNECSDVTKVFGAEALMDSFKKCTSSNRWKQSIQKFQSGLAVNCANISDKLLTNRYKNKPFKTFRIIERGHKREVQSLDIRDMVVQGSFRDNLLHPLIRPLLVYDNGACLSGKGSGFALKRFVRHLSYHVRKFGVNGYIYFFDFKSFFSNIDKERLIWMTEKILHDITMRRYFSQFINGYCEKGLGLGSSVSQICAVYYPNALDHYIKDALQIECYGRYMDDGYIICENRNELKRIIDAVEKKCLEIGITLNKKKCKLIKLTRPFKFLKVRFSISNTGKIIRKPNAKSNTIERRRLRKFKKLIEDGIMQFDEVLKCFHSWLCSRSWCKCFYSDFTMVKYFNQLFSSYGYYHFSKIRTRKQKVLQYISRLALLGDSQ